MPLDDFVGRQGPIRQLCDVLLGKTPAGQLAVMSIEGPGGIGKSKLFHHVRETMISPEEMTERRYLTLSLQGDPSASDGVTFALASGFDGLLDSASGAGLEIRTSRRIFPNADRALSA